MTKYVLNEDQELDHSTSDETLEPQVSENTSTHQPKLEDDGKIRFLLEEFIAKFILLVFSDLVISIIRTLLVIKSSALVIEIKLDKFSIVELEPLMNIKH